MNIQQALKKERPLRRKSWTNNMYWEFSKLTLDENDILAEDWEVEGEEEVGIPTEITLEDKDAQMKVYREGDKIGIETMIKHERGYPIELTEKEVDKLLDFLYYNTKIGNDRITPF